MKKLPLIVGFGGINAAGRSSFHHSYRRMVHEVLPVEDTAPMFKGLAALMNQPQDIDTESLLKQTLIRKIEKQTFDLDAINAHRKAHLNVGAEAAHFKISKRQLPKQIPENWTVEELEDGSVKVSVVGEIDVMMPVNRRLAVSSAGQLPTGFDPAALYNSRN